MSKGPLVIERRPPAAIIMNWHLTATMWVQWDGTCELVMPVGVTN